MGRILNFLRIFTVFSGVFVFGAVHAADYYCPELKQYSSCNPGFYLTLNGEYNATPTLGNQCTACPSDCTCVGGTADKVCGKSCDAGKFWNGTMCATCSAVNYYCPGFSNAIFDYSSTYGRKECPATEEGWTRIPSPGKVSITDCAERQTPDGCTSGHVQKNIIGDEIDHVWGNLSLYSELKADVGHIVSGLSCPVCPDGTTPNEEQTSCVTCPKGQICKDGIPESCPENQTPNNLQTECVGNCPINHHFNGTDCVQCNEHYGSSGGATTSCTPNTYEIHLIPDGGSFVGIPSNAQRVRLEEIYASEYRLVYYSSYDVNQRVTTLPTIEYPETDGRHFVGWFTEEGGKGTMFTNSNGGIKYAPIFFTGPTSIYAYGACDDGYVFDQEQQTCVIAQTECEYDHYWDGEKCAQCQEHYESSGGYATSCTPKTYEINLIPDGPIVGIPSNATRVRLQQIYNTDYILTYYSSYDVNKSVSTLPTIEYPETDGRHFVGWFTEEGGKGTMFTNSNGGINFPPSFFKESTSIYSYGECDEGYAFDQEQQRCIIVQTECEVNQYWDGSACAQCPEHQSSSGGYATDCTTNVYEINLIHDGEGLEGIPSNATNIRLLEVYNSEYRLAYSDVDESTVNVPKVLYSESDGRHFVGWFTEEGGKGTRFAGDKGGIGPPPNFFTESTSIYAYGECDDGYRFDEDQKRCVIIQTECDANQYWNGSACAQCPEHYGSSGGYATECTPETYEINMIPNGPLAGIPSDATRVRLKEVYNTEFRLTYYSSSEVDRVVTELPTIEYTPSDGRKFVGWFTQEGGKGQRITSQDGNILVKTTFFTETSSNIYSYGECDDGYAFDEDQQRCIIIQTACDVNQYWNGSACAECDEHYGSSGGYVTSCTPNVYEIDLIQDGGTLEGIPSNATRVKLKEVYNTEFRLTYSSSSDVDRVVTAVPKVLYPESDGRQFVGWFTQEGGKGQRVTSKDGNILVKTTFFTDASSNIYSYGECNIGYEFDENLRKCVETKCEQDHYWDTGSASCARCPTGYESDGTARDQTQCYAVCQSYPIEGGTAVPVSPKAMYPAKCEYKGVSDSGGTCDIIDGKCVLNGCRPEYELINNACVPCNRDGAEAYKQTGNCQIERCRDGMHPNGDRCENNVRECSLPNAISASESWDFTKKGFTACMPTECVSGYHVEGYSCTPDEQACKIDNGVGIQEWDYLKQMWGECVATSCDPGYTNDPFETSEPTKQCGQCKNKFSLAGDVAARYGNGVQAYNDNLPSASSYVRGCEIATCMYQGKKYALEDNFCRPICAPGSDETGSKRWTGSECKIDCNDGFTQW